MIFSRSIPAFYWPAKIVFIDDNYHAIKIVSNLFQRNSKIIFADPSDGVEYINNNKIHVSREEMSVYNPEASSERNYYYLVKNLYKKLYQAERFDEITTLVIDYNMPQCTGLEAITQITNPDVKTILLTGVATEEVALSAFNKEQIDRYIKKLMKETDLQLREYVDQLQTEFFVEKSERYFRRNIPLKTLFENPVFIEFFSKLVKENNIVEFYLIDEHGSLLLVDLNGKIHALILHSEEVLTAVMQLMAGVKEIKPADSAELENKTKLIPYTALEAIDENNSLYSQYMLDCQKIPEIDVYYALTADVSFLKIDHEKIKFFKAKSDQIR